MTNVLCIYIDIEVVNMQGFWGIRSQIHLQTVNFQVPYYDYLSRRDTL